MEAYEEQQAKERKMKYKENRDSRENGFQGRRLTRHCDEKYEKKEKTVKSEEPLSEEVIESRRPNLRTRKQKKMNIVILHLLRTPISKLNLSINKYQNLHQTKIAAKSAKSMDKWSVVILAQKCTTLIAWKWQKFLKEIGVASNAWKKCPKNVKQEAESRN